MMFFSSNDKNKIKKLEREIKKLKKLVFIDELTGVYNRRGLIVELVRLFEDVKRSRQSGSFRRAFEVRTLSIMYLDIDNFKKINDNFGHALGDKALKLVAKILKNSVRDLDIVGRMGGEEFLIGFAATTQDAVTKVAEHIRKEVAAAELKAGNKKIKLTASIGVKEQSDEKKLEDLIKAADKLMYKAKITGKNKVVSAD